MTRHGATWHDPGAQVIPELLFATLSYLPSLSLSLLPTTSLPPLSPPAPYLSRLSPAPATAAAAAAGATASFVAATATGDISRRFVTYKAEYDGEQQRASGEGGQQSEAPLNSKALDIIDRVQDKLTGYDFYKVRACVRACAWVYVMVV